MTGRVNAFVEWDNPLNRCDFCNEFMTVDEGTRAVRLPLIKFHIACHEKWSKLKPEGKTQVAVDIMKIRRAEMEERNGSQE